MNRQKLLLQMINLTLVALLLAACGAPAGVPMSASPTTTPAPSTMSSIPTAVATPTPASTSTPTPMPTLTPAPTSTPTSAPTPTLEPQAEVVLAWHEAFNRQDIDAFMALVADNAVLDRGPYGVITGTEKIRATVTLEMKEKTKAKVSRFEVKGDQVTYYYEVFVGGRRVDQGVGVAIVENGKIKSDLPAK